MYSEDSLEATVITGSLRTRIFGRKVVYYPVVGSTNEEAKRLAEEGAPEGTLVIADEQKAGKGRLGRRWFAPPGTSLLMSLIFRPPLAPYQAQRLTVLCSLAIAEAVEEVTPLEVNLKWPNDILINGKKAGGILTELGIKGGHLAYVVVGIGLNVNVDFSSSQEPWLSLRQTATSLYRELGYKVPRLLLLLRFLEKVEEKYEGLGEGRDFHSEWARRLVTLHRRVCVSMPGKYIEGWAEAVDEEGALLVRTDEGVLHRVLAGDVTLRPAGLEGKTL